MAVMGLSANLILAPAMLGAWSGSCHVTQDDIFNMPDDFTEQLNIGLQDKTILSTHQVNTSSDMIQDEADKLTDLMMIFIQGPSDLATDDWNFHYYQYTARPGDTPQGIWKGFTQNHADVDPSGQKLTISNTNVLGYDAEVIFHTTAELALSADKSMLQFHSETGMEQVNFRATTILDCTYRRAAALRPHVRK
jgi:hypothetical protein